MDLTLSCKTLAALFLSLSLTHSFVAGTWASMSGSTLQADRTVSTTSQRPADQSLLQCIEIAKQGDVKQAFQLAKDAKTLYRSERMFDVSYINTLITIADQTQSKMDLKILNEVIQVVNDARQSHRYDGTGDPEVAYHFMTALGRLAEMTNVVNDSVASKIQIFQGEIAINLTTNANYPKNALEALGEPMVNMAKAYASREDREQTLAAIKQAVGVGYGEYETLLEEEWLTGMIDEATRSSFKLELDQRYQVAVRKWSRTVVAQFRPMDFRIDVAGLDGKRFRNDSFAGKVAVVDLWATWCAPCRKGIPHYMKLHESYSKQGVAVVGVSMDNPTDPASSVEAINEFVEQQKVNYPIAVGDQSIEGQLPQKMLLPTTLFFDRRGKLQFIAQGYHDYAKLEAITKVLMDEDQMVGTQTGVNF